MAHGEAGARGGALAAYVLLGAGTLFPWNAFITAADYYNARFPGRHADRLFTVAYLPVNFLVLVALIRLHSRVRPGLRIAAGFSGYTLALVAAPLLDLAPDSAATLGATLLLVAATGACDGLAQGALFGEAALLPPAFTHALVMGTAVSGVLVSLLRVVTKATLPGDEAGLRASAVTYFSLAAAVTAACGAVHAAVLPHLPAIAAHRRAALQAALERSVTLGSGGGAAGGGGRAGGPRSSAEIGSGSGSASGGGRGEEQAGAALPGESRESELLLQLGRRHDLVAPQGQELGLPPAWGEEACDLSSGGQGERSAGFPVATYASQLRCIWRHAAAVTLTYIVTLSIFPGVLAEDVASAQMGSWYPVILISLFNLADAAGKGLPGLGEGAILRDGRALVWAALGRALFVPLFHLAASRGAGPAAVGLLTLALGSTNGYLTACAMMAAPPLADPQSAALAGNAMVLSLVAGLCLGAALGFLWLL